MSARKLIDAQEQLNYCRQLLKSYDLVIEDLSEFTEDEWVFVAKRVRDMRADISDEVSRMEAIVGELEAK